MESNVVPIFFFCVATALMVWAIVRNFSWSMDTEMLSVRKTIEKGLATRIKGGNRRSLLLGIAIAIGSHGMSFRIIWWALAGFLVILSAIALIVAQSATIQNVKSELIPEDEILYKRVRRHKIAGCIFVIVLVGWIYGGLEYLPR